MKSVYLIGIVVILVVVLAGAYSFLGNNVKSVTTAPNTSTILTTSVTSSTSTTMVPTLSTEITLGSAKHGCNALVKVYVYEKNGPINDTCAQFSMQLLRVSNSSADFDIYSNNALIKNLLQVNLYNTTVVKYGESLLSIYLNSSSTSQLSTQLVINVTQTNATLPCSNCTGGPTSPFVLVALQNYRAPYCQGASQAPVGQSGLACAEEINSTAETFNSVSGAFDCAGFVQYVYGALGIKIPSKSQAQFGNFYPADAKVVPVPGGQANTVPGDLVYFSIPGDHDPEPAHVAMCYVAGCNIIIQNGGPLPGMPGDIAPLNALLCTNQSANVSRCIMEFAQVTGSSIFRANQSS